MGFSSRITHNTHSLLTRFTSSSASSISDYACGMPANACGMPTACNTMPCGDNFQRGCVDESSGFRKSMKEMFGLHSLMGTSSNACNPCAPICEAPKKRTGFKEEEYTVQVPFTKKIKVPVQVPTYRKKTVCREVTEQRTKWVKQKVPVQRIVKETVKVPCMKTVMRTQTQKCFRTETKLRKVPFEYEVKN